ncbi:hypothetical protein MKK70_02955 [Methylobacterium sp. E-041]|jgi:hypothetical protein|uniref:hypothetical protein n=1 Tax=Methylobacterium sp. E-041 TaxID=2836573 RepID=UPI001FBB43A7|nr:hypothetical protein [Methylobacterium sp. E-041]MCJ2104358.1 hypothetical protein [Methylobacterium sp. E-041]
MRFANLIPASHIARSADPRLTANARRAVITAKAAIVAATESAKRFDRTEALVNRDGTFNRSAIMRAAILSAQARMEVTGDAWGVCMSYALKGAWAAAKASRPYRAH